MSRKDPENPEWTGADFAAGKDAASLSDAELSAFPRTRGRQKAPTKVPVSIRLDSDLVAHFKSFGPGWQSRMNDALRQSAEKTGPFGANVVRENSPAFVAKSNLPGPSKPGAKRKG